MPATRVWTCDLPGCTVTATSDDIPPGWFQVFANETGVSQLAFHNRADLVTWCGATLIPRDITIQEARAVVRQWKIDHPKG